MDGALTVPGENPRSSPRTALVSSNAAPPATSCIPEVDKLDALDDVCFDSRLPAAQDSADPRSKRIAVAPTGRSFTFCHATSATPAKPGTKATNVVGAGRCSAGTTSPNRTTQKGIVASIMAAIPDGIVCCA